jgi:hypothetical protein
MVQSPADRSGRPMLIACCDLRAGLRAKRWFDAVGHGH